MLERYQEQTRKSENLFKRAQKLFPAGVNHNIRTFGIDKCGAYPPFMKSGDGGKIWDVDGNEYVDWWMTHYSKILGHNNSRVNEAIKDQLNETVHLGALNEAQVEFGEMLQEAIPSLKKMRFCSTGSEATMYAVRLARLFTGKQLVGKTLGGWHGGNDALGHHLHYPFTDKAFFGGAVFDFNDRESVDILMKNHGENLAAVIIEPVLGAGGGIAPDADFLKYLREETEARDILLIFDEIITGFRFTYGVAGKEIFGVEPDIITLGKIVGGGMPLGVYGGREDVMKLATPGIEGGRWVGGGTFSSHPLTMAAGIATLKELESKKTDYSNLSKTGEAFRMRLNKLLHDNGKNALATGFGSVIFINWFKGKAPEAPLSGKKIGEALDQDALDRFQGLLLERGIFGYHGLGALSFSHTDLDLERTYREIGNALKLMES